MLDPTSAYWSPGRKPAGWWEPLRTEDNKDNPPPELMMYDEYEFRFMGLENKEEADGDVESGKSATTNLFSSEDRIIEGTKNNPIMFQLRPEISGREPMGPRRTTGTSLSVSLAKSAHSGMVYILLN